MCIFSIGLAHSAMESCRKHCGKGSLVRTRGLPERTPARYLSSSSSSITLCSKKGITIRFGFKHGLIRSLVNRNLKRSSRECLSHGNRFLVELSVSSNERGFPSGRECIESALINGQDSPCGHPSTRASNFASYFQYCGAHMPASTDGHGELTSFRLVPIKISFS